MQEHIKDAVRDAWAAAWDHGEFESFRALAAPNYVRESSATGRKTTLDEYIHEIEEVRAAFPDLVTRIDRIVLEGNHLAVFWTSEGTFTAPFGAVPPTGRRVLTHGCNNTTLVGGLITHEQVTWDSNELLRDLGLPSLHSAFEASESQEVDQYSTLTPRDGLKAFNKQFVSGVTVVTTKTSDGTPKGLAASSYTSVSLDPPLILICVQKTSSTYAELFRSTHFGVNILASEQRDVLDRFASKMPDKFDGLDWHDGPQGSPLIDGSSASIEVEIKERLQALTHTVFIGRVCHAETNDVAPILYKAGKFYDGRGLREM